MSRTVTIVEPGEVREEVIIKLTMSGARLAGIEYDATVGHCLIEGQVTESAILEQLLKEAE